MDGVRVEDWCELVSFVTVAYQLISSSSADALGCYTHTRLCHNATLSVC